jgi:DNA invertase Pin-like site-specific DNA recombinase
MRSQRIHAYIRTSTKQHQKFDSQESELTQYCQMRGWENVTFHYDQISGAKTQRDGLDSLMQAVRKQKVDVVCAFKLDRLGRSLSHLALLIEEFTRHGVALVIPSQGIDTSNDNPAARLQLDVLMAVASFERSIIRDRVQAGINAAKAKGVTLGRPKTTHKHGAKVVELKGQGLSLKKIGKELGISAASVCRLLKAA